MSKRTRRDPLWGVPLVRSGGSPFYLLGGLMVAVVVIGAFLAWFVDFGGRDDKIQPLLATVTRGLFQHVVLEGGEIESSSNVEVRCEIRARATGGPPGPSTTILEVVPEGTLVEKGDWLVTFDSSLLEQERRAEQINLNTMEANMIEAKALYDTALITREEFLKTGLSKISINLAPGDFGLQGSSTSAGSGSSRSGTSGSPGPAPGAGSSSTSAASSSTRSSTGSSTASAPPTQTGSPPRQGAQSGQGAQGGPGARNDPVQTGPALSADPSYGELKRFIENEIFVAENSLKRARLSFDSMKRLVARGVVDRTQLEGERFRVDAAQNVMDLAKQKLAALENYTRRKLLVQLESNFRAAEVRYGSERKIYEEQLAKLQEIDEQTAKCRVVAPAAGQVVYKNVQSRRASNEFVVEPGAFVRENQVIMMLPDPSRMQARTLVEESRINLVKEGMAASVRVDAFDSVHEGRVAKVNKYAESTSFFSSSSGKQYLTLIQLMDLPPDVRVGLTAQVGILVEERADALQMPFQTVYKQGGKHFCLVRSGNRWKTCEVVVAATNERMIVVDEDASDALREGDRVVLNPRKHLDLFDRSRLPSGEPEQLKKKAPPGRKQAGNDS